MMRKTIILVIELAQKKNNTFKGKKRRKEMEEMTNEQFEEYKKILLELVLEKIENSKDLEQAKEKIKKMINK